MAVTYNAAVKTARMTATRDHFANGTLEILTAADAVLATFGLDAAGGTVSGAVWTLVFDNSTVAAGASGTAAKAQIKTGGGTAHLTGLTVGTSGSDINLDSVSITSGQNVTLSSATVTHAA
ncbi:hypothetical protein GOL37_27365 [Sinorhizobium medicae]|nr:hypothetical protein [Sinorhizobium medicae]MDX0555545.1 hypothetical protein [Sinorhizobium medicae]MDX1022737.1 hypothetical protein [Sinorhizobium medicae]MDX1059397.1 hypothetical protein [Sinorhizobium medicae]